MKYFSLKILIICILMPPILYIASISSLEKYVGEQYEKGLVSQYLEDTSSLLDGSVSLQSMIETNIRNYLDARILLRWGATANVTVKTEKGQQIYPVTIQDDTAGDTPLVADPRKIAEKNYQLLNEKLILNLSFVIGHNTFISNTLLLLYILIFMTVFYLHYRSASGKAQKQEEKKDREIDRLLNLQKSHESKLEKLGSDRDELTREMSQLKNQISIEKTKASKNEEELLEEVISLEEKIETNINLQQEQEKEISELKNRIERFKDSKKRKKSSSNIAKRFSALYKQLSVHSKAIDGFLDLTEDMKIRCEEVIHQLNEDSEKVTIKRKVFGKKNRETVFEVVFAYKGRLYFRKTKDHKVEVLAVGTKNTQSKELEFLDNL